MRGLQLGAGLATPALPAQPLAVHQMCAGQFSTDAGAAEPLDRLPVEVLGLLVVGQQGPRSRLGPERPVRPAGPADLAELPEGGFGLVLQPQPCCCLDEFGEGPVRRTEPGRILDGLTRRVDGSLEFTESVVQQRYCPHRHRDAVALAASGDLLHGAGAQRQGGVAGSAQRREGERGVGCDGALDGVLRRRLFLNQSRGSGQFTGEQGHESMGVQRQRSIAQDAGRPHEVDVLTRHLVPASVIPGSDRGDGGQPCPPVSFELGDVSVGGVQGSVQGRQSRGVATGEEVDQPVQHKVSQLRWARRTRGLRGRSRDLLGVGADGQPAREHRRGEGVDIGGAAQVRVDRLQPLGRLQQQRGSITAALGDERDPCLQQIGSGALHFAELFGPGEPQQIDRGLERPRLDLGRRRGQHPFGAFVPIRGQCRRSFQEGGRRADPAATLRAAGRLFEFDGDLLVGSGRGVREMPSAAVDIVVPVGGLGESPVHPLTVLDGAGPVRRRAHQRMPEAHPGAESGQVRLDRGHRCLRGDIEEFGRPPDQGGIAGRFGRGEQQQQPRWFRQRGDTRTECGLHVRRNTRSTWESEAAGKVLGAHLPGQLQQGQRVAPGLGDDLGAYPHVEGAGQRRIKQRSRVGTVQTPDHQGGQPGHRVGRFAGGEHQRHRLRTQPPGHEGQHLRRGPVQPLLVIDQTDQRSCGGRIGEQVQHRQTDQEAVWDGAFGDAQCGSESVALRHRQSPEPIQERLTQLVYSGEGQLHLGLHARRARHLESVGCLGEMIQQCGLADAGFAAQHQRPALPGPQGVDDPGEDRAFVAAPDQTAVRCQPGPLCQKSSDMHVQAI